MGDYIEFFAEIDLLGALSACPGGDTSSGHSDDTAKCYPLLVQVFEPGNKEAPLAKNEKKCPLKFNLCNNKTLASPVCFRARARPDIWAW